MASARSGGSYDLELRLTRTVAEAMAAKPVETSTARFKTVIMVVSARGD